MKKIFGHLKRTALFMNSWLTIRVHYTNTTKLTLQAASVTDISTAYYQANHELQASKFINSVGENIHSILSLIVDYKGFRVLAHADYKAEKCSLVYCIESEVPFLNKEVSNILSTKGQLLNLKPHTVMLKNDTKYTIYGSSSIQVYQLLRIYLIPRDYIMKHLI